MMANLGFVAVVCMATICSVFCGLPSNIWELEGDCLDCGFTRQVCDLKEPCNGNDCKKGCVQGSWGNEKRPFECDIRDNWRPNMYYCFDDNGCYENQKCCHTSTGSYCSSGPASPWKFPGDCLDCGYGLQRCGVTKPCELANCRKACINGRSSSDRRPWQCDAGQNRQPNKYQCFGDWFCEPNEKCCTTRTGSYCSRQNPTPFQRVFSGQLSKCDDCRFDTEICDLKAPCQKDACELGCVRPKSRVIFWNRRPNCTASHQTRPNYYECWHDEMCNSNQNCCHTDNGSYCGL